MENVIQRQQKIESKSLAVCELIISQATTDSARLSTCRQLWADFKEGQNNDFSASLKSLRKHHKAAKSTYPLTGRDRYLQPYRYKELFAQEDTRHVNTIYLWNLAQLLIDLVTGEPQDSYRRLAALFDSLSCCFRTVPAFSELWLHEIYMSVAMQVVISQFQQIAAQPRQKTRIRPAVLFEILNERMSVLPPDSLARQRAETRTLKIFNSMKTCLETQTAGNLAQSFVELAAAEFKYEDFCSAAFSFVKTCLHEINESESMAEVADSQEERSAKVGSMEDLKVKLDPDDAGRREDEGTKEIVKKEEPLGATERKQHIASKSKISETEVIGNSNQSATLPGGPVTRSVDSFKPDVDEFAKNSKNQKPRVARSSKVSKVPAPSSKVTKPPVRRTRKVSGRYLIPNSEDEDETYRP